ncbi:leucine-rich repeat domain-containing protein [uncultured Prevotella sp.]|uniref:leucine-rich repeat domain-containing protein n=1 Tax=uncultured Prevotella sp. TaxID=159272 RepID=UPI0027E2674F|nr:leucine-rich repeat domain-containing protein [uncultured Prevotella sp.]
MKIFKFKHPRRVYFYTLLSFLMCMLGASSVSAGSRTPRNPIVKMTSGPTYSNNGTEVTLKLWMYNYDGDNAYFLNNVMLRIDDKDACTLNNMWNLISNVHAKNENNIKNYEKRGNVGSQGIIKLDGVNVGTAQFCNAQKNQTCPYNGNTGETKWTTIELKLSFNNSFSYRKHTVSVKGLWRDRCDDNKYSDTTWDLKNTLHGFVYPTNLDISRIGYDVKFTWEYSGSETNETRKGKWVLYKIENGKCVKQVEDTSPYIKHFTIPDKDFRCLATYYLTFQPNALNETTIITGLTKSYTKGSHDTDKGECKYCKHGIFSYTTTDGKTTPLASNMDFGSKILSHTIDSKGTCIIEFEGKFTRIPDGAFKDTKINSNTIEIPETVTSIGSYAFANTPICGSLIIPNSVTEIKEGAFENCRNLNSLKLPSNLKRIESLVFKSCGFSGSLTIPNSVTEIGHHTFYGCNNFTKELILSENLEKIGSYAFAGCSGFSKGNLTIPNSVTVIGIGAFSDCSSFNGKLTLPENLTKIGKEVFKNCKCLSGDLTIPNSVTEIGEGAFYDCKGFNGKLSLPCNLSKIGNNAFYGCENLSGSLTIPETVKEIGILAFCNCTGFTGDFVLPSALESIGINAFGYTQEKNKLVFQSLPKGMRYSYSFCNMKKCVNLSDASYVADDATVDLDEASYSRTMSNTWGTLMLPYKITLTGNEPYSLYKIETLTGNELVLSRLEGSVAAGTPCIVKRNGTEAELTFGANDAELNMAIATTTVGGMTFRGTYWTEEVNSGYVISKDCFWNVEELKNSTSVNGVKVRPFRAWLDGTSANAPAQLSMRIDDNTTGINAAEVLDALNDAEAEYYDLSGKRLVEPQRGVNIVRMKSGKTKKIIIK